MIQLLGSGQRLSVQKGNGNASRVMFIDGGAHVADLFRARENESEGLKKARKVQLENIQGMVGESVILDCFSEFSSSRISSLSSSALK